MNGPQIFVFQKKSENIQIMINSLANEFVTSWFVLCSNVKAKHYNNDVVNEITLLLTSWNLFCLFIPMDEPAFKHHTELVPNQSPQTL